MWASLTAEHGLSSCDLQAGSPRGMWGLLRPRPGPVSPALQAELWGNSSVFLSLLKYSCTYLVVPVLSCGTLVFFFSCGMWHLVPWPGIEARPLQWEWEVLATGPLGKICCDTALGNLFGALYLDWVHDEVGKSGRSSSAAHTAALQRNTELPPDCKPTCPLFHQESSGYEKIVSWTKC